jgi:cytochrome c peroxidase
LFYYNILSIDSSISCASCHKPNLAFSDDRALSPGVKNRPGTRNAPSLTNVAYHPYFLREGGVPTLEMQVLVPIQEENEFNHNIVEIGKLLKQDPEYVKLSKLAYNREPDYYVITRALGVFERTLISGDSKYDKYKNKELTLTTLEKQGLNLFFSEKTKCSSCHSGFNFTDYTFQNNGLYEDYNDIGRLRFSKDSSDLSLFKVPTLRNIEVTAPYMHDGSVKTLEDVINHYNTGGKKHVNKSDLIIPLQLTNEEKLSLIAFLKTLTDESFINNEQLTY